MEASVTGLAKSLFGGGMKAPPGPSAAQKAAELDRARLASEEAAKADRMAALATSRNSRRDVLSFNRRAPDLKSTTGG